MKGYWVFSNKNSDDDVFPTDRKCSVNDWCIFKHIADNNLKCIHCSYKTNLREVDLTTPEYLAELRNETR